jgi:hypothetical protein
MSETSGSTSPLPRASYAARIASIATAPSVRGGHASLSLPARTAAHVADRSSVPRLSSARRRLASCGWTSWSLLGVGAFLLLYAALVLTPAIAGRPESARARAGFIPDCIVLCSRLLSDPRVPRRKKACSLP